MKIEVTQEDIDNGRADEYGCPIALAMIRAGCPMPLVWGKTVSVNGTIRDIPLPL